MSETAYQNNGTALFTTQAMGYNKDQVDEYIQRLSAEYSNLLDKYNHSLAAKADAFINTAPAANVEAVGRALVDAQAKGMEIIAAAKSEAAHIVNGANSEYNRIETERNRLLAEMNHLLDGLKKIIPVNI